MLYFLISKTSKVLLFTFIISLGPQSKASCLRSFIKVFKDSYFANTLRSIRGRQLISVNPKAYRIMLKSFSDVTFEQLPEAERVTLTNQNLKIHYENLQKQNHWLKKITKFQEARRIASPQLNPKSKIRKFFAFLSGATLPKQVFPSTYRGQIIWHRILHGKELSSADDKFIEKMQLTPEIEKLKTWMESNPQYVNNLRKSSLLKYGGIASILAYMRYAQDAAISETSRENYWSDENPNRMQPLDGKIQLIIMPELDMHFIRVGSDVLFIDPLGSVYLDFSDFIQETELPLENFISLEFDVSVDQYKEVKKAISHYKDRIQIPIYSNSFSEALRILNSNDVLSIPAPFNRDFNAFTSYMLLKNKINQEKIKIEVVSSSPLAKATWKERVANEAFDLMNNSYTVLMGAKIFVFGSSLDHLYNQGRLTAPQFTEEPPPAVHLE